MIAHLMMIIDKQYEHNLIESFEFWTTQLLCKTSAKQFEMQNTDAPTLNSYTLNGILSIQNGTNSNETGEFVN